VKEAAILHPLFPSRHPVCTGRQPAGRSWRVVWGGADGLRSMFRAAGSLPVMVREGRKSGNLPKMRSPPPPPPVAGERQHVGPGCFANTSRCFAPNSGARHGLGGLTPDPIRTATARARSSCGNPFIESWGAVRQVQRRDVSDASSRVALVSSAPSMRSSAGDATWLDRRRLREHPDLVRGRSTRTQHSMLICLHTVPTASKAGGSARPKNRQRSQVAGNYC
jgi:hypothetical protein